jgi:transcriptional regulator with XRE-family HTH domain
MNKYKIARKLGISHQAVYKWFNGQSFPSTKNLIKLSEVTGKTIEEVISLFNK